MMPLRRAVRNHRDAGSLNRLLAPWGFVDDHVFLTKAGSVGLVYRLAGVDDECLDVDQRREVVHRYEATVRLLDEGCRVYQYLLKRRIDPLVPSTCAQATVDDALRARTAALNRRREDLYDVALYAVLLVDGAGPRRLTESRLPRIVNRPAAALRDWLSPTTTLNIVARDLERRVLRLSHLATGFEAQLADTVRPTRLHKSQVFTFFRRLVNYAPGTAEAATLHYDTHLDFFMGDGSVECHRTHLDVQGTAVTVLTMKEPPAQTSAHLLAELVRVPGECIACLEWQRLPIDRVRRDLHRRRRHFFNTRISLVNYVSPDTRPEDMLVDESATATIAQLGDALTALDVEGHVFGDCSLTMVLYDRDRERLDHAAADATKVLAAHDGTFVRETYNLLNAWLSLVPGNGAYNLRRLALLETNYADLSLLFTVDQGEPRDRHLDATAVAVLETTQHTPYWFTLHVEDVGHTLVLGATGSGKSYLLNFLVLHAQQYHPLTVIFDLGHSYRDLATRLHGSYLELGIRGGDVHLNPFAFPPTPEHLHFVHGFVCVLLEGTDRYHLSQAEDRELYDAIENLYVLDRSQRRLFTLANLLPRALAGRLAAWIEGGRYAEWFDAVDDTLSVHPFQVFDFEAMRAYPVILEPLLFAILHRVELALTDPSRDGRLLLCVMDEAWRFIQHPRLRSYLEEALKTWRKRRAAMLLATQTIEDFASADLLRTVVESCPTKLLLANPALDRARYADLFQLNATELDAVANLVPRSQLLLKRPRLAKVLTLAVDETERVATPGERHPSSRPQASSAEER